MQEKVVYREGIRGLVLAPEEPRGLLVWYHGWSSAQERQHLRAYAFARAGWEVVIPAAVWHDDRGSVNYDAPDSYPKFWKTILQNIKEAPIWLAYGAERGFSQVVATGHSMGGFTALGAAANVPGFAGVIAMNGSGHWPLSHLYFQARFMQLFDLEADLAARVEAASPHNRLEALRDIPIRIMHGALDPSVDPRADQVFVPQAKAAGVPVTAVEIPHLGHYVTTGMLLEAVAWLDVKFPRK